MPPPLLIDTHALLWWLADEGKLPRATRRRIADSDWRETPIGGSIDLSLSMRCQTLRKCELAVTESRIGGALSGALALVAAGLIAIAVSGRFDALSRDRGFLQFVVVLPAAALLTALILAWKGCRSCPPACRWRR